MSLMPAKALTYHARVLRNWRCCHAAITLQTDAMHLDGRRVETDREMSDITESLRLIAIMISYLEPIVAGKLSYDVLI